MLKLVETKQTIYSQAALCNGLIQAWYAEYKAIPSKASIGVIIAQNAIETGGKYFWNNNWGNSKVGADVPGQIIEYMMLRNVWEIENGKRITYQPPHRATWFRSFPTLAEGIGHHLALLKNRRYKIAWAAVEKGDVALFAHLLKKQGYYTAPEADYIRGMMGHYNLYNKSGNYEKALAEFDSFAPPLQPWVELDLTPGPMGELIVINDAEDAKIGPQEDIEREGTIALTIKNFVGMIASWLKPKS